MCLYMIFILFINILQMPNYDISPHLKDEEENGQICNNQYLSRRAIGTCRLVHEPWQTDTEPSNGYTSNEGTDLDIKSEDEDDISRRWETTETDVQHDKVSPISPCGIEETVMQNNYRSPKMHIQHHDQDGF